MDACGQLQNSFEGSFAAVSCSHARIHALALVHFPPRCFHKKKKKKKK